MVQTAAPHVLLSAMRDKPSYIGLAHCAAVWFQADTPQETMMLASSHSQTLTGKVFDSLSITMAIRSCTSISPPVNETP